MSVFVKICGLRSAADIEAAATAGADAVGFVFAPSVRQVSPAAAARAAQSARGATGLQRVAVMRHPTNAEWLSVLTAFRPDVLQTDAGDLDGLDIPASVTTWPVYRQGGPEPGAGSSAAFLYEGAASGRGTTVDWHQAAGFAGRGRMILAGGLAPGNVAEAIGTVQPWGVDVSSGVESAPGQKDPDLVLAFVKAARAAEYKS